MMDRVWLQVASSLAVVSAGAFVGQPASAVSFRVDNKVFVSAEKEPRSQSTTIFHEGLVYDFLDKPGEITIFDPGHHRFVLLDPAHRVKTEVSSDEVAALCDNLQSWAKRQADPLLRFMAEPRFEEGFDEAAGDLAFKSEWMTYRVAASPVASEAIGRQYREFSDWYTRLNARLNPGSKLPFARLEVNRVLDSRHVFPREVKLAVHAKKGGRPETLGPQRALARNPAEPSRPGSDSADRAIHGHLSAGRFRPVPEDDGAVEGERTAGLGLHPVDARSLVASRGLGRRYRLVETEASGVGRHRRTTACSVAESRTSTSYQPVIP